MRQTTFVSLLLIVAFCLGWHFAPEKRVVRNCNCCDSPEPSTSAKIKYR